MNNKISGFKAFNSKFQCLNFQFEVGKEYEIQGELELCKNGFHFCENPFEVWGYYPPTSRFAAVIGENVIGDGNKSVCSKIQIERELTLNEFIAAGVSRILDLAKKDGKIPATNTGDRSAATNTGNKSAATNTGDYSVATNTGYNGVATNSGKNSVALAVGIDSLASVEGENSIAIATGENSKAKGKIGSWLVLTDIVNGEIINIQSVKIDGSTIKEDVFYTLKNNRIIENNSN